MNSGWRERFRFFLFAALKKTTRLLLTCGIGKIQEIKPFLYKIFQFFAFHLQPEVAEVQGSKMTARRSGELASVISVVGAYEPNETELVKREVMEGQTAVDVGAMTGYYTLLFARLVGPKGKVFAFEPHPVNVKFIQKNLALNGYANVTLVPKAVSNFTGTAANPDEIAKAINPEDMKKWDYRNENSEVSVVSLDDYFSSSNAQIDFVKIDVEGAEYFVLQGMRALLQKNKGLKILAEFSPSKIAEFGLSAAGFLRLLEKEGFHFFDLNRRSFYSSNTGERAAVQRTAEELLGIYTVENKRFTDLFCRRA